jgi:DNA topoisomerase-1
VREYLSDRQFRLYELIWGRFVASQMKPARYEVTTANVEVGPALFVAHGRIVKFDGFTRVMARGKETQEQLLPALEKGDQLQLIEIEPSQHFTQPPPRFTEASLVRELEKQGIGRPSTYAPTISTLLRRNYVRRERRAMRPTDLGAVVCDLLVEHFPREMDVSFTSTMEEALDAVEEGKRDWRTILEEFYGQFSRDLARAREGMEPASDHVVEGEECPECGKPMVMKYSRKGDRFLGCSGFPECKSTRSLGPGGEAAETEFKCSKCGAPMLQRTGRRGRPYLSCSAYPECRNIMGLDAEGNPVQLEQRIGTSFECPRCGNDMHIPEEGQAEQMVCSRCRQTAPLLTVMEALGATEIPKDSPLAVCEKCGAPMEVKRARKGLFLGCSAYPDCRSTMPIPKASMPAPQPTFERCDKCDRPLVMRWGQYGRFLACSGFPRCRNLWKVSGRRRKCPADGCNGKLMVKKSSGGEDYLGCTRYPRCDHREPVQ